MFKAAYILFSSLNTPQTKKKKFRRNFEFQKFSSQSIDMAPASVMVNCKWRYHPCFSKKTFKFSFFFSSNCDPESQRKNFTFLNHISYESRRCNLNNDPICMTVIWLLIEIEFFKVWKFFGVMICLKTNQEQAFFLLQKKLSKFSRKPKIQGKFFSPMSSDSVSFDRPRHNKVNL